MMRLLVGLILLSTCAACAGSRADPASRAEQGATMPLTFLDGSTTVLHFDSALGLDRMKLRPYQWGRTGDSQREFGPWHLRIWDYGPGDEHAADALTPRQQRIWRTHLHGTVTHDGFLVLSATPP